LQQGRDDQKEQRYRYEQNDDRQHATRSAYTRARAHSVSTEQKSLDQRIENIDEDSYGTKNYRKRQRYKNISNFAVHKRVNYVSKTLNTL
jgi:hypothetical protein